MARIPGSVYPGTFKFCSGPKTASEIKPPHSMAVTTHCSVFTSCAQASTVRMVTLSALEFSAVSLQCLFAKSGARSWKGKSSFPCCGYVMLSHILARSLGLQ